MTPRRSIRRIASPNGRLAQRFIIPYTLGHYFAASAPARVPADHAAFRAAESDIQARTAKLLGVRGKRSVDSFHRELGLLLWEKCGMARDAAGLRAALQRIPALRDEFWRDVNILGGNEEYNTSLEMAGRVADFLEFAELVCTDALQREESCGGHFRTEYQTEDGEALRNDESFSHVSAWEYTGPQTAHLTGIDGFATARIGFIFLAGLIPVITSALSYSITGNRDHALFAGILACIPAFYLP